MSRSHLRPPAGRRALERLLGHRFARPALLRQALTHRSATHESGGKRPSNEALEFLGDAVLGLLAADLIYRLDPSRSEGEMSKLRAALVSRESLRAVGTELALGPHLRLGRGEEEAGGRERQSILADACEAVIGAIYLDGGLPAAAGAVHRLLQPRLDGVLAASNPSDPKSALQEILQRGGGPAPVYRTVAQTGPAHARRFRVEVRHGRRLLGSGEGGSLRQAEQRAAQEALARHAGPVSGRQTGRRSISSK